MQGAAASGYIVSGSGRIAGIEEIPRTTIQSITPHLLARIIDILPMADGAGQIFLVVEQAVAIVIVEGIRPRSIHAVQQGDPVFINFGIGVTRLPTVRQKVAIGVDRTGIQPAAQHNVITGAWRLRMIRKILHPDRHEGIQDVARKGREDIVKHQLFSPIRDLIVVGVQLPGVGRPNLIGPVEEQSAGGIQIRGCIETVEFLVISQQIIVKIPATVKGIMRIQSDVKFPDIPHSIAILIDLIGVRSNQRNKR